MAVNNNQPDDWTKEIDAGIQKWCQGDYVVGEHWFIQRFNPKKPLTDESKSVTDEAVDLAEYGVRGFVVVTQTCDIVRSCIDRPFIEVVPQNRLRDKHDKSSPEGEALRALREIRVKASPSWNDTEIELMFWFIRHEEQLMFQGIGWDKQLIKWLELISESGRFKSIDGQVITLEDMTAKEYIESDQLDLDHLSS